MPRRPAVRPVSGHRGCPGEAGGHFAGGLTRADGPGSRPARVHGAAVERFFGGPGSRLEHHGVAGVGRSGGPGSRPQHIDAAEVRRSGTRRAVARRARLHSRDAVPRPA